MPTRAQSPVRHQPAIKNMKAAKTPTRPSNSAPTHAVVSSNNVKLRRHRPGGRNLATTFRARTSCPGECPFLDAGCYAAGRMDWLANHLAQPGLAWAYRVIEECPEGTILRHFSVGDLLGTDGKVDKDIVTGSHLIQQQRPDIDQYGYTHAWRRPDVTPTVMPGTVLNASCETAQDVKEARAAGWDTVVTVATFDDIAVMEAESGFPVSWCPAQRRDDVGCADCQLCAQPNRAVTVAFVAHGAGKRRVATAIERCRDEQAT